MAVNSSQQVKDDGIVILGLGISSKVNEEMLKTVASSEDQILIFPGFASSFKVDITSDLTAMICEGKYLSVRPTPNFSFQFAYIVKRAGYEN